MNTQEEKTIFSKIIDREIPGVFLYEDDKVVAILDKFPNTKGQTLVIPKKPIDYILDLDDETYTHLWKISKKISKALQKTFNPKKVVMLVEGFEVPHTHVKLYPVLEGDPFSIETGQMKEDSELEKIATEIRKKI